MDCLFDDEIMTELESIGIIERGYRVFLLGHITRARSWRFGRLICFSLVLQIDLGSFFKKILFGSNGAVRGKYLSIGGGSGVLFVL